MLKGYKTASFIGLIFIENIWEFNNHDFAEHIYGCLKINGYRIEHVNTGHISCMYTVCIADNSQ